MVLTAASRFFITGAGVETRMVHTLSGGAGSEKFWTAAFRLLGCFWREEAVVAVPLQARCAPILLYLRSYVINGSHCFWSCSLH
jgi:hypothetical protein